MSDNKLSVTIGGKSFILSGYEPEYLEQVAEYLNKKHEECNEKESYRRLSFDMQSLFLQLNIADDYFNSLKKIEELKGEIEKKNNDIYDIKHELVNAQMRNERKGKR